MKEMAALQPGMNFYGSMPAMYALVVNTEQPSVIKLVEEGKNVLESDLVPVRGEIETLNGEIETLRKEMNDKKEDSEKETLKTQISDKEKAVEEKRTQEEKLVKDYASTQPVLKQIIDLALLQSGLLKGENLTAFIRRSISLL